MFNPSAKIEEIVEFVVDTVVNAGGRPCPPVIVGVGIGGNIELSAVLAKRALFTNTDERGACYRGFEQDILQRINERGRGVMGLAGSSTALEVRILTAPCHIASLPVAVNLDCHAHRHIQVEI
jgi:fumarate hydratase subunit alpha